MRFILRPLIFLHRWVGIALCLVFLLWFPSGIGMMYWTFPSVTAENRLERSPKLDPSTINLSPVEAAAIAGVQANPTQVRLNSFDGRPVYRFGRGGRIVYADTGEEQMEVTPEMLDRIASAWASEAALQAKKESVEEPDQWTVGSSLRNLRPMYKYTWPDGQQVYLNGLTGEVVQYTTFATRLASHVSAIPHWVYYTPLRKNQPQWLKFMIWSSLIGTLGAILGMVVAVLMYSPRKRYRLEGNPTGIPYRGYKRWHWIFGMVFGVATITWTFSGLLSLGPFPIVQRLTERDSGQRGQQEAEQSMPEGPQQQAAPTVVETQRGAAATNRGAGPPPATPPGARRGGRGGQQGIAGALRGRVRMSDFEKAHPGDILAKVPNLAVKEMEWTSFAGTPIFSANLGDGDSQYLSLDGAPINGFDQKRIIDIVKSTVSDPEIVEIKVLDQYDLHYLDRTRKRPLPVILVLTNDDDKTRYYIDPRSARVVHTYSSRNWVNRWLYTGLHSLNFPFLYNHRPLWDIVVIAFMVGGTALCVTSLVLAWRTLGRKLRRAAVDDVLPRVT